MATATLRINVEGPQQFQRVLGQMLNTSRRANESIVSNHRSMIQSIVQLDRRRFAEHANLVNSLRSREAAITNVISQEQRRRETLETRSNRTMAQRRNSELRDFERLERQKTDIVQRQERQRENIATVHARRASRARSALQTISGAVGSMSGAASSQIEQQQEQRRIDAARERSLNDVLAQTVPQGATIQEMRGSRARIAEWVKQNDLNMDDVIPVLDRAQSRYNVLGGNTAQARSEALNATLENMRFASLINPGNMEGLTMLGGMLRTQGVSAPMQQEIMRNAAGINFAGSVETETALRESLPAMLRDLSSTIARRPNANRDELVRDSITDFLAQIQSVAASGNPAGVSGNRMTMLQDALSNQHTQDRLGAALQRRFDGMNTRRMTPEQLEAYNRQRAEFRSNFTQGRDGHWRMNADIANSPSEAAAFFGHLFNNDQTAVSNFLGVHGGGGRQQLLRRNEIGLLTSYFAQGLDQEGRSRPQYELVKDLRSRTLSERDVQTLQQLRSGEQATALQREENNRQRVRSDVNNSWFGSAMNAVTNFTSQHPLLTSIGGSGAMAGLKALGSRVSMSAVTANMVPILRMLQSAGSTGIGGAIAGYGGIRAGEFLQNFIGGKLGRKPETEENTLRGMVNRRGVMGVASDAWDNINYLMNNRDLVSRELSGGAPEPEKIINPMKEAMVQALIEAAPRMNLTVSPTAAAHAAGVAATGPNAPPMQNRQ